MNLEEKSQEVRKVFEELDLEIKSFLDASKLPCISGCGFCCSNPQVSASVLEFLPLAFDLYAKGKAEKALDILEKTPEEGSCIVYKSLSEDGHSGFCSDYNNRGMICRLFGSSARKNKNGQKEIITCKKIKTEKNEFYTNAVEAIQSNMPVPSSTDAYRKINNIDFRLTERQLPINKAIKEAIESVITFKFYTENQEPESVDNF
ncbi:YkgJ family cysteine cluster protein [Aquiflexum lacus]|uniref:YkgJ family cysteine cluster protein n=1 Tax=Aquiflexum lacus TaxID=2483805 RepID=UPI001893FC40|nr:YkgJ family cysteine cluster protein [Aquiflexum lacus]